MADPLGPPLGPGGLISLFRTCCVAYDVFVRSARNLGKDYYRISVFLGIERQKLRIWGQYLGISPSQQCRLLLAETVETQRTAVIMLESIKALLDDIGVIMVRYDVRIEQADSTDATVNIDLDGLDLENLRHCPAVQMAQTRRRETERSVKSSTSALRKIKWALTDSAKLSKLVDDLRLINENLWICLPLSKWLPLATGLPSVILPEIHDQAMLRRVEADAQESQTTKLLAACSDLRRAAIVSENNSSPSFGEELRWPDTVVQPPGDPKLPNRRYITSVNGADTTTRSVLVEWRSVLVEWRYVERAFSEEQKEVIRSRIKALAVLLSSPKSSELGLLKCIGFFKDNQLVNERYGLMLEIPSLQNPHLSQTPTNPVSQQRQPCSLYQYIDTISTPLLGDRFRIALALCNIVLQIHASNWLHKAICSSNVIFLERNLQSSNTESRMTQPFLVGFDFSRPDRLSAESLEQGRDKSSNAYRHPNLWPSQSGGPRPRFHKEHDIFSLGVVLLEIGNWKLAEKSYKLQELENPEAWKAFLLKCTKQLGYRCGRIYQEVVENCLNGIFVENPVVETQQESGVDVLDIKRSFLFDVVYQLARCSA